MASLSTSSNAYTNGSTQIATNNHPLQFLKDYEIRQASSIVLRHVQELDKRSGNVTKVHFKNISLHDPPKALLLPHLDAEAAGVPHNQRPYVPRCVDVLWSTNNERNVTETTVCLNTQSVTGETSAAKGQHGPNDRCVATLLHRDCVTNITEDMRFEERHRRSSKIPKCWKR
jgi:Cu2+-containing amine oxidase